MARILVVDDDDMLRRILCDFLEDAGHEPFGCDDPAAAAAMARKHSPDLAILDYSMPGMTGTQLLASLRKRESTSSLPVVFLSGSEIIRFSGEVPVEPNVRFMTKPLDFPQLQAVIADLLASGEPSDEAA
jgi:CheY-like chemotaxis protein